MEWEIAGWVLAVVLMITGMAGTLIPVIPSTPTIFAGMLLAGWLNHFERVGWITFIILIVLVVLSQAMELVAGSLGAKKAGASSFAMWGSLIGAIIGLGFGLPGLLLGPMLGAGIGEYLIRKDAYQAGKVGLAALIGFLIGAAAEIAAALAMFGVFVLAWFL